MENASKALIIAGAILIAILLITIGIVLVNSGRSTVESGTMQMSAQSLQAFNAQFTSYEGTGKSSSQIIRLIDTVIASNASNSNKVAIRLYGIENRTYSTYRYNLKRNWCVFGNYLH